MNAREAKRHACRYLATQALHGAADADDSLTPEDDVRVTDALYVLAFELYQRGGEPNLAAAALHEHDEFRAANGLAPLP